MRIAIDNSPLVSTHKMAHKIRGTGFYTKNLINSLEKYFPENEYILFTQGNMLNINADIYHYPYFDPFFLTLPLRKVGRTVITIHDLTPLVFSKMFPVGLKGIVKLKIQKFLAKKADGIITDSISSKKDIQNFFGINTKKIFPVLLASDEKYKKVKITEKRKNEILTRYSLPEKFLLYVGDATPNKNLPVLIDAVEKLNLNLVMVGAALSNKNVSNNPWNKDILYVQKHAAKNTRLHILGFVSDEELLTLYNLATLFIFPSFYEGFGLPLLEAASCGLPIITTNCGSIPEVVGDGALLFKENDKDDLSDRIMMLLNNKNLRLKYAQKAYERSKLFSWEKTASETIKVYETIFKKT